MTPAELQKLEIKMGIQSVNEGASLSIQPATYQFAWRKQHLDVVAVRKFLARPLHQISDSEWLIRGPQVFSWLAANANGEINLSTLCAAWQGLKALDEIKPTPEPPRITQQPEDVWLTENEVLHDGKSAVFTIEATGGITSYQWFKREPGKTEFQPILGATGPKYVFCPEHWNSRCAYVCDVTNSAGTTRSNAATFRFVL